MAFLILIFNFYADSLYNQGDYFRAITEYKRLLFYGIAKKKYIYYKIGECYEKMGDIRKALYFYGKYFYLEENPDTSFIYKYAFLFYRTDKFDEGISLFKELKKSKKRDYFLSYGYLKKNDLKNYLKYLPDKKLYRNEKLWKIMSLFLPGVPQIFNRHITEGITSLLANSFSLYLIYKNYKRKDYFSLSISTVLFLRFYTGNFSSVSNYVREYNLKKIEKIVKKFYN